ncbi:hypothetical protein [Actinomadura madurae]|uniref:hypothetical protein n=1 Tax=Actinomadura madurae TaxID=1993 RepID=UPI00202658C3|nr:hypothetical protein [Actinomadura madurae]MCP9972602.1 hypothetical protein [Actinomadura madurae]MCP9985111.1 hypothetical protein [Actinomadura madurae]MCQ0003325.1 hypothetical protein [Actinomadura madurae]MCQ0021326.1 hypothetical protein [Actinomadura madurae]URN01331.1 hypothetical protein LUW76_47470 [Actinomadura madurae]
MKGILVRVRAAARGLSRRCADRARPAGAAVRAAMMAVAGTMGAGRPAVVIACAAVTLATDLVTYRLAALENVADPQDEG